MRRVRKEATKPDPASVHRHATPVERGLSSYGFGRWPTGPSTDGLVAGRGRGEAKEGEAPRGRAGRHVGCVGWAGCGRVAAAGCREGREEDGEGAHGRVGLFTSRKPKRGG